MKRTAVLLAMLMTLLVGCQPTDGGPPTAKDLPAWASRRPMDSPGALTVEIGNGAAPLRPRQALVLRFSRPVKVDEGQPEPVFLYPYATGRFTWNESMTALTFQPEDGFLPGATYRIQFDPSLVGSHGEPLMLSRTLSFEVLRAPRVLLHSPGAAELTSVRPEISVLFSRAMDRGTVEKALDVQPGVALELEWRSSEKLVIRPAEALSPGTRYRFAVRPSASDAEGIALEGEYVWEYWLPPLRVNASGPTFRQPSASVAFTFNYAVDPHSVARSLDIQPRISGVQTWNKAGTVLRILPSVPLPRGAIYSVNFTGPLQTAAGDPLPAPAPIDFYGPPPVLEVDPPISRNSQDSVTEVSVLFDRPMDHASTEAAFKIEPAVPGAFAWEGDQMTYRLALPVNPWAEYRVTVEPSAVDAAGNPALNEPFTWTFTASYPTRRATFADWGARIQVVDAAGRRAVQFGVPTTSPTHVAFEAHEFSLRQFVDLARNDPGLYQALPILDLQAYPLARSWELTTGSPSSEYANIQEVILPKELQPGIYLLSVKVAGRLEDQLLVLLTRNTVVAKRAGNHLFVWVTDINGDPVEGAEVRVYTREGRQIREVLSDEAGMYRTVVADRDDLSIVAVRVDRDVTATGLSPSWRTGGGWWWWSEDWGAKPPAHTAYIYTDRPIYRPGQTVYFKAIIRLDDDAVYSLPPKGTPVQVRVRDSRDNIVQTYELSTGPYGSVDGAFDLAEGAMLGNYVVEATLGEESHRQTFKVQDYRKPDVELTVEAEADSYILGDQATVNIEARYFHGAPVAGAELKIKFYELGEYYDWWSGDGSQLQYIWYDTSDSLRFASTGADGRYTLTFDVEMGADYYRQSDWRSSQQTSTWGVEVTLDDGSHQTVSSFAVVRVHNSSERLGLELDGGLQTPGEPFNVIVSAATLQGEPLEGKQVQLDVRQWSAAASSYERVVRKFEARTDANGRAVFPVTVAATGYYKLLLTASDDRDNPLRVEDWIYIYKPGQTWAREEYQPELTISADREKYAPYERAQLLIESTFPGPALLTFERGRVRRERLIQLTPPMTLVEMPILESDAPNIFVTVSAWKAQSTVITAHVFSNLPDSRLLTATVELPVDVTGKSLNLLLTPDKNVYAPGERASVTINVTDHQGEPVEAEVSLAVVDEAIFSLSEELSRPILEAFYGRRSNRVQTFDSMAPYREIYPPGRGGGGDGGPGGPRSSFADTAAWFPNLRTDASGQVVVTLTLPDNLTSWRLTAKAATGGTLVGEATINVLTQKEIIVRPILPRTLTAGDKAHLSAMVHNEGERIRDIEVSLESDGLEVQGQAIQTIRLEPGETRIIGWTAAALEAGEVALVMRASSGDVGDAVRLALPVRPLSVPDVMIQAGSFVGGLDTKLFLPSSALPMSRVTLELSRSPAASVLNGLDFLTGFPYGCVEQTMSRALPNAVVSRAFHQLEVSHPSLEGDLPEKVNAGLQQLYGLQHDDGGWGWWYDDVSHDYQTAWVVFGLAVTQEAGHEVDSQVIRRGTFWLAENLAGMDIRTRAFALYSMALAGAADEAASLELLEHEVELDAFSRAALALTLHELGRASEAKRVASELAASARIEAGMAYWPSPSEDGHYYEKVMASSTRTTAMVLSALVRILPGHELEPAAVSWLMSRRTLHGWGTTNETAFTVLALTDHLVAAGRDGKSLNYHVALNGEVINEGELGSGAPIAILEIEARDMRTGLNDLRLEDPGGGRLYYVLTTRVYLPQARIGPAGTIQVSRHYLDGETGKRIDRIQAGQLVKVVLTVELPEEGFYILVEDNLPGGLEALNEGLNTTSHDAVASASGYPYYWQDYGYNNKQVHGDRVSFFITELSRGRHRFTYLARATHSGVFISMPAEAWAMYDLELWGRSGSDVFRVLE